MASSVHPAVRSFEIEAEELLSRPRMRRARAIVHTALLVVALLLVWAALAHVDEVTRGDGKVIPSRQLQVLQSLDGGVVTEILVKEGQVVEAGQMLLKLEETRATSGMRESAAQGFALRARVARLRAIAEGAAFQPPAVHGNDAEERRIVEEERRLYESRQSELQTMLSINQQQLQQRQQELDGHWRRIADAVDETQQEIVATTTRFMREAEQDRAEIGNIRRALDDAIAHNAMAIAENATHLTDLQNFVARQTGENATRLGDLEAASRNQDLRLVAVQELEKRIGAAIDETDARIERRLLAVEAAENRVAALEAASMQWEQRFIETLTQVQGATQTQAVLRDALAACYFAAATLLPAVAFVASRSSSASSWSGFMTMLPETCVPSSASTVGVLSMPIASDNALVSATGLLQVALPGSWPFIAAVYAALRSAAHHTACAFLSAPGWMSSGNST